VELPPRNLGYRRRLGLRLPLEHGRRSSGHSLPPSLTAAGLVQTWHRRFGDAIICGRDFDTKRLGEAMFGRDWEAAEATIVTRRLVAQGHGGEGGHLSWEQYEYVADVRPDDGAAAFRAVVQEPRNGIHFQAPDVGQVVRVKFHAKDHHVKFDHDDPGTHRDLTHKRDDKQAVAEANSASELASFKAIAQSAPGSRVAPTGGDSAAAGAASGQTPVQAALQLLSAGLASSAPAADAEVQAASEAFQAALAEGRQATEAFIQAKAAGQQVQAESLKALVKSTNDEVQRTNREYQRLVALKSGRTPASGAAPAPDPLDRLQKLADLHDRGALSDAEFAAAKAKLLAD
jgi:hypothetical protein